ncbi:MAG: T9SS type A sorting domain-containing protein, partial [Bacteroidia bacterium]|nr:T9SS type A sorting domain-containing protein [Bacteroidia bacterium]
NPSTNVLANNYLTQIHAFDLKARITSLSDGNFALVGAVQKAPWSSLGCSSPPSYIMNNSTAGDASCGWNGQSTDWWYTDTYVAKVDVNAIKLWDKSFDSDTPFSCSDYPTSVSSGGGDPKRQECMYGVSEAPDGGIVVSGNNSSNADDNYMAKLYFDCNLQQTYDINGLVNINSSVTWNSSHMVKGIIKINSGGTLNITGTGTTIQFADSKLTGIDTRIEIYPGGKLNINGATLTSISNCPNSMWDGIKLIGNGDDAPQTTAYQPNINLSSATIKNARLGIENGIINGPAYSSGGWIIATNSTFLNNYIDVSFLDYKAPIVNGNEQNNKSIFTGCTFKSDNYLNDPSYVSQIPGVGIKVRLINFVHVSLSGVKGVRFIGNTFKADLTAIGGVNYTTNFRGVGIKSSNSIFDVFSTCLAQDINGNCTGYGTSNVFENLLYGVFAGSTDPLKKFSVVKANFTNCNSSIYQSGINYSTVNKNNFVVNTTIPQVFGKFNCSTHPEACMTHFYYLNNSSGFSHQENNYSVTSSQKVMGTVFNACGTGANESYRNTYSGCHVGHQAQLTNGNSGIGMNGLQIKCNQNSATKQYDIAQTSGVLGEQGFCDPVNITTPANNTFSHFQPSPPSDINAFISGGFNYHFTGSPSSGSQVPFYITSNVILGSCGGPSFSYVNSCKSKLINTGSTNPPKIVKLQTDAQNFRQIADQLAAELDQKLLDGASITLINAINSTMDNGNLKNLLLSKSPYLSDNVLITYLQRSQTPPAGHIQEIIIANSPVSSDVKLVLDNMNLPNGIRNQINTSQAGTSIVTQNKQEIAYNVFNKDLTVNEIVRYYLDDTITPYSYDYITKWLEWNKTIENKYDLVFAYTQKENYTRAQTLIDSLNTVTNNAPHIDFLQGHKNLKENHKTWRELNTDVVLRNKVEALSSDSLNPMMGNAREALSIVYVDKQNYELIEGINNASSSRLAQTNNNQNSSSVYDSSLLLLSAYPNPFNNSIKISYTIDESQSVNIVEVFVIELATGRLVAKQTSVKNNDVLEFNTDNIASGVYVINIKNGNTNLGNLKVINIK